MKKRIIPDGYKLVESGTIYVGDMVWNKLNEAYQVATQECNLSVGACISVVRPKDTECAKILHHLMSLCELIKDIRVEKYVNELKLVGTCGRTISRFEFYQGGKLKKAHTQ